MTKQVERQEGTELSRIVDQMRRDLRSLNFGFGALFVGHRDEDGETEFALIFADGMPQAERMQLLEDLQKTLDASKQTFEI